MSRRPLLQRLDPPSIAVFRALHLGDMLCAVPALRALRETLPRTHVTLVGLPWARQFVDRFGAYVDEFVAFPGHPSLPEQPVRQDALPRFYAGLCERQFTLALQLHGSGEVSNGIVSGFGAQAMAGFCRGAPDPPEGNRRKRSRARRSAEDSAGARPGAATPPWGSCDSLEDATLLPYPDTGTEPERLLALVEQIGAVPAGDHLEFPLDAQDEDELRASGLAATLVPGTYLCVHPGARQRDKCWPPYLFAEVADHLVDEFGLQVVLTGSSAEADLTAAVAAHMRHTPLDAAAPLSIGAMAVLMRDARLLLCNDTGVSHIAAGLKLDSVVVFSKADIARWAPLDRHRHRCIWDPDAERVQVVLQHARALLAGTAPSRQRTVGMWPYW
jgi:ADP-heptose:LPS heptosyltransferase